MEDTPDTSWRHVTDLSGKTVVVTGCASGIGRATALQFASAGAIVYGGDRNDADGRATLASIRAAGGQGEFVMLDLTEGASIDAFVDQVTEAIGGAPDIIANVAGLDRVMPFLDNTPDVWELLAKVNFIGPVRMIHRFLPRMIERRSGKIVTVASDAGRVGSTGETFYAGTKGAIIAFTKSLARELARYRINCNCVAPGPTSTPLFHSTAQPKLAEALVNAIPFRRLARPSEIAHSIVFLSSPAADFITGQVFSVSGGLTMHG